MIEAVAETDFLIGLIHKSDRLHETCIKILNKFKLHLSLYSILEYRLIN